jgi:cation diffusion facilitator CzcD-associated flavoprotein CzcO
MPVVATNAEGKHLRFVIIGAGMAGLLAGIRLKQRGDADFVIYEKGHTVGGTWRENAYPGVSCDTPAHSYTYSFAPNPEWSAYYAPGAEIQQYFERITDVYDLRRHIRFGVEIASCQYLNERWHVRTTRGDSDVADVVVAATGVLHHPSVPELPGLHDFRGAWFHSARWDRAVPLDGKRIGVIGNGSTGVQIVSALARRAARLVHFQRTPQWIMPCPDTTYTDEDRRAFREDASKIEEVRSGPEAIKRRARFTTAIIDVDSPELAEIQATVERNLEQSVRDPVLREKLRPDYRAACKRLVFSAHYYQAVQQPAVYVEAGSIENVESAGIRMRDGSFHELDLLVLATGFKVNQFVRPTRVTGRDGIELDDFWAVNPRAYYAVTIPHFPNFFLLNGPTGPVGNFSLIDIAERQWAYIEQLVQLLRSERYRAVEPSIAALNDYEARRTLAARRTVFASGCKSWYLDASGEAQAWPWSYAHFIEVMAKPKLEDYELVPA